MNKNIFSYSVKWFLIVILVSIFLWAFLFDAISRPKDTETVSLFLTAEASDSTKLRERLTLDGVTSSITTAAESSTYYSVQFTTTALISSDLIVMNTEKMPETHAEMQFAPLTNDLLEKYGIDATDFKFVTSEEIPYAIVVFDKEHDINLFDGLARFDEAKTYCIAVNVTRPNAAPFSTANKTTDNTFVALTKLLSK